VIAQAHPTGVRYSLGGLLAFGALNALGGGYYGLTGAVGVPTEWLEGSPFAYYFVPSLILLVVVGGSFAVAAIAVFARLRAAPVRGLHCRLRGPLLAHRADRYHRLRIVDAAGDGHRRPADSHPGLAVASPRTNCSIAGAASRPMSPSTVRAV